MGKIFQLQWTPLQIEIAGKLLKGGTFNALLEGGQVRCSARYLWKLLRGRFSVLPRF